MKEHDGRLPTVQECLDARNPTKEFSGFGVDVYKWMWLYCFPCTAHRSVWNRNNCFEYTPSSSMPGFEQYHPFVSLASEAYFLVQLENNYDRWTLWHQETVVRNKKLTKADMRKEEFKTKYSVAFRGQEKFKGFSEEGLVRFEELKDYVERNRLLDIPDHQKDLENQKLQTYKREQLMLRGLRAEYGKDRDVAAGKRGKKQAPIIVSKRKRICIRDEDRPRLNRKLGANEDSSTEDNLTPSSRRYHRNGEENFTPSSQAMESDDDVTPSSGFGNNVSV